METNDIKRNIIITMRTKNILYIIIAVLAAIMAVQLARIQNIKHEYNRYKSNTETLLADVARVYETKDSLHAVKVEALNLKLSEYKKYRAADMELINTLQVNRRDLQNITKSIAETKAELSGKMRDSIVYIDNVRVDTLRTIDIQDAWLTLHGEIANGDFRGTITSRDTILAVISVKHKRALGFLWKTKKIKDTHADIVSKNPYTRIKQTECVVIQE